MGQYESERQICCAEYYVRNIKIKATLLSRSMGIGEQYCILLEQEEQQIVCEIGDNLASARGLFFQIVSGGVTLCTLNDVAEDQMGTIF